VNLTKLGFHKDQKSGLVFYKKAVKFNEKDDASSSALAVGAAFGVKGVERAAVELKNRRQDFRSLDEVLSHYKNTKPGDVLFFQETFTGGKGHPIVVLDSKSHYYWPTGEAWNRGIKSPIKVKSKDIKDVLSAKQDSNYGVEHLKRILKGRSDINYRDFSPTPLKGKFFEIRPGNNPAEIGSLEGKLWEMSSHQKKVHGPNRSFTWTREFSPNAARRLSSVWRSPDIDPSKITPNAEKFVEAGRAGKIRYNPINLGGFNLNKSCSSGHCIQGADELLRMSGANRPNKAFFPKQLEQGLYKIKDSKTLATGKLNMLSPIMAMTGVSKIHEGLKENNSNKVLAGSATVGAGVAINTIDSVKDALNSIGGIASRAVGGMVLETPSKIVDKIKSISNGPTESWKTTNYATQQWMGRHPKAAGRVGAVVLGLPAAYGIHKAIDKLSDTK